MIVTAIQLAALQRSTQKEAYRITFYLYVDEMHSFVSLYFADILAEAPKYKLSLFLTHQYIDQINEKIRAAIFGNVGTLIVFRVGAENAQWLAKEFHTPFNENDFGNLPRYAFYIKLMIDGATSKPFSACTVAAQTSGQSNKEQVIKHSKIKYVSINSILKQNTVKNYEAFLHTENEPSLFDQLG